MKNFTMQGRLPTTQEITTVYEGVLDKTAAYCKGILDEIVSGWAHKPQFTIVKSPGMREIETDSDIFGYVDEGTRPHIIRPVKAKSLVFCVGGSAKTQPNVLGSGKGSKGNTIIHAKEVHHPGNAPRNFSANLEVLADKYIEMTMDKDMQALIDKLDQMAIVID